jgi:2-polyprenyl-3-methyl-5-hydroxy-6-metoxy-1,4-benzoquinol methylase
MSIRSKINWVTTGFAFFVLKQTLRYKLRGNASAFLQPVKTTGTTIFNRLDFILSQSQNKKVLHIGFTDYPFTKERIADKSLLHLQLQKITKSLLGVDVAKNAIEEYNQLTGDNNVICGDITKVYPEAIIKFEPELILLTEVLEHLKDPYTAIELLHQSFKPGTKILVTVPNYTSLDALSASLNKTESIHPLHYWYFSPFTLTKLFDETHFTLEQLHFGMYYQPDKKINAVMRKFLYTGDCIMAIFSIKND